MFSEISIEMDNQSECIFTNNNEVQGQSSLSFIHLSKELFYEIEQEKALRIGKTANTLNNIRSPDVSNEATPSNGLYKDDIINVQLLYDPQAPTEPEL